MTRPLAIAHLTTLEVAPLPFVEMAARIGYKAVGLRLHTAFPGSPFYEIPGENISFGRGLAQRAHISDQNPKAA
jgi:hypothetical protein